MEEFSWEVHEAHFVGDGDSEGDMYFGESEGKPG
jgi:hypothetical protein